MNITINNVTAMNLTSVRGSAYGIDVQFETSI